MILLQIFSLLFGLFMIYVARIHLSKQHIQGFEFSGWASLWSLFIFLVVFPETVSGLAQTLRISRVFDLLTILALMVLTYLTFENRIFYKKLEKKLEKIIRKNALNEKK